MLEKYGLDFGGQRPPLLQEITYVIPVPDGEPLEASPLSGFAPSLCFNRGAFELASTLPSNLSDYTQEGHTTAIARRMAGQSYTMCFPQTIKALTTFPVLPFAPFMVILSPSIEIPKEVRRWIAAGTIKPVVVSPEQGDIQGGDLSWETLKLHFLKTLSILESEGIKPEEVSRAKVLLDGWVEPVENTLGYKVKGHGSIMPNVMTLDSMGYKNMVSGPFEVSHSLEPYIKQIVLTTNSIAKLRADTNTVPAFDIYPPKPALNLYSVGLMAVSSENDMFNALPAKERVRAQTLMDLIKRQDGYSFQLKTERQRLAVFGVNLHEIESANPPAPHPIFHMRQLEVNFSTSVVGALASSEASAVIRLPNSVNRSIQGVKQFAQQYRSRELSPRKRIKSFKTAQKRISDAVPSDLKTLMKEMPGEIRVISDAHLEWMEVDGLPLFAIRNLSRVAVTPGNLFVSEMAYKSEIRLRPSDFSEVLVINGLKEDDPINGLFTLAFDVFSKQWKSKLKIKHVNVSSSNEFIDALNSFDGPLVVFDGHGSHEKGEAAKLHFQDESCDVWSLRGKINSVPPIVILSACDTHAADRNHATVANGLLSIGVRSVLASVFPLDARDASSFTARLLYRLAGFLEPAISVRGQPISWTEVIGGMLRMQLLTDYLRGLLNAKLITDKVFMEANNAGNIAINMLHENPFEEVLKLLVENGLDEEKARLKLSNSPALSSALAYLNVGRSDTILIDTEERYQRAVKDCMDQIH